MKPLLSTKSNDPGKCPCPERLSRWEGLSSGGNRSGGWEKRGFRSFGALLEKHLPLHESLGLLKFPIIAGLEKIRLWGERGRRPVRRPQAGIVKALLFSAMVVMGGAGCAGDAAFAPEDGILLDFEDPGILDRMKWKCRTLFFITENHATHGKLALLMEFYPSPYPGFSPGFKTMDWRGYEALEFDIFNPQSDALSITLRIDDKYDAPEYADRYNGRFLLEPGDNRIRIPFSELKRSGDKVLLDVQRIFKFNLFMASPKDKKQLYLDYVRLVKG